MSGSKSYADWKSKHGLIENFGMMGGPMIHPAMAYDDGPSAYDLDGSAHSRLRPYLIGAGLALGGLAINKYILPDRWLSKLDDRVQKSKDAFKSDPTKKPTQNADVDAASDPLMDGIEITPAGISTLRILEQFGPMQGQYGMPQAGVNLGQVTYPYTGVPVPMQHPFYPPPKKKMSTLKKAAIAGGVLAGGALIANALSGSGKKSDVDTAVDSAQQRHDAKLSIFKRILSDPKTNVKASLSDLENIKDTDIHGKDEESRAAHVKELKEKGLELTKSGHLRRPPKKKSIRSWLGMYDQPKEYVDPAEADLSPSLRSHIAHRRAVDIKLSDIRSDPEASEKINKQKDDLIAAIGRQPAYSHIAPHKERLLYLAHNLFLGDSVMPSSGPLLTEQGQYQDPSQMYQDPSMDPSAMGVDPSQMQLELPPSTMPPPPQQGQGVISNPLVPAARHFQRPTLQGHGQVGATNMAAQPPVPPPPLGNVEPDVDLEIPATSGEQPSFRLSYAQSLVGNAFMQPRTDNAAFSSSPNPPVPAPGTPTLEPNPVGDMATAPPEEMGDQGMEQMPPEDQTTSSLEMMPPWMRRRFRGRPALQMAQEAIIHDPVSALFEGISVDAAVDGYLESLREDDDGDADDYGKVMPNFSGMPDMNQYSNVGAGADADEVMLGLQPQVPGYIASSDGRRYKASGTDISKCIQSSGLMGQNRSPVSIMVRQEDVESHPFFARLDEYYPGYPGHPAYYGQRPGWGRRILGTGLALGVGALAKHFATGANWDKAQKWVGDRTAGEGVGPSLARGTQHLMKAASGFGNWAKNAWNAPATPAAAPAANAQPVATTNAEPKALPAAPARPAPVGRGGVVGPQTSKIAAPAAQPQPAPQPQSTAQPEVTSHVPAAVQRQRDRRAARDARRADNAARSTGAAEHEAKRRAELEQKRNGNTAPVQSSSSSSTTSVATSAVTPQHSNVSLNPYSQPEPARPKPVEEPPSPVLRPATPEATTAPTQNWSRVDAADSELQRMNQPQQGRFDRLASFASGVRGRVSSAAGSLAQKTQALGGRISSVIGTTVQNAERQHVPVLSAEPSSSTVTMKPPRSWRGRRGHEAADLPDLPVLYERGPYSNVVDQIIETYRQADKSTQGVAPRIPFRRGQPSSLASLGHRGSGQ